jgi:hypothetical protein
MTIQKNIEAWLKSEGSQISLDEPTVMSWSLSDTQGLSNKDIAIRENVLKERTRNTFMKNVYIRKSDDAIVADSLEEFMTKITDPCHIWQGQKSTNRYGYFSVYSRELGKRLSVKAHRFAYAMAYGFDKLPVGITGQKLEDLVVNHKCHNRECVNPEHLEIITDLENKHDRKPKNG